MASRIVAGAVLAAARRVAPAQTTPAGPLATPGRPGSTRIPARSPAGHGVAEFLANDAIRTTPAFALTETDELGVDWASSNLGTPAQAERVSVPTLVVANGRFQFVVPAEIVHDHLASRDRMLAVVEGSDPEFRPCASRFGDTRARLFDFVAEWLGKPSRF